MNTSCKKFILWGRNIKSMFLDANKTAGKDGNYTIMLRAILNKSWRQHATRHQLYDHLPPITKTIQVRRTKHAGHCWSSRDELISYVLLWTPTDARAKAGRPAKTYIQQLFEVTGCSPEDQPEVMNDREKRRERVRDIRAGGTTWWWWWYQLPGHAFFFYFFVSVINHCHIDGLHLFWHSFEWFCLQISSDTKYFFSLLQGIVIKNW